jgi:hypothetical protein
MCWSWTVERFSLRERHRLYPTSEASRSLLASPGERNAPIPAMADIDAPAVYGDAFIQQHANAERLGSGTMVIESWLPSTA